MGERDPGRLYVTGAGGFLGSHVVDKLLAAGHEVTALCQYRSDGSVGWLERFLGDPSPRLRILRGDIRDAGFIEATVTGHRTVLHLAALVAIPHSYAAPRSYFDTNVGGTLNVAAAALKAGVTRLVHTSTSEVYGSAQVVPMTEAHPLAAQSPYAASKVGADQAVAAYMRSFGLPAVTLRPFNAYGPRQSERAVIPAVIAQLLDGNVVRLGATSPTRDFTFADDTAEAFLRAATGDASLDGETFHVATGTEISIGEVVQRVAMMLRRDARLEVDERRLRPAASEVERLRGDASRLRAATGWQPRTSFDDGLSSTIAWLRSHPRRGGYQT